VPPTVKAVAATALAFAAALAAACATESPPMAQLTGSEAAVATVREAGASRQPSGELALAEEKLQLSRRFMATGESRPARWLAEQAGADAELAAMKVQSARAMVAARDLAERARVRGIAMSLRSNQ